MSGPRKRLHQSAFEDHKCEVCKDIFNDAQTTPCGHTFCKDCIRRSIRELRSCPNCKKVLNKSTILTPNSLIQTLADSNRIEYEIEKFIKSRGYEEISHNVDHTLAHFLRTKLQIDENKARKVLLQRQQRLIQTRDEKRNSLVTQFLEAMQIRKREDAFRLVDQSNEAGADLFMLREKIRKEGEAKNPGGSYGSNEERKRQIDFFEVPPQRTNVEEFMKNKHPMLTKHYESLEREYCRIKETAEKRNQIPNSQIIGTNAYDDFNELTDIVEGMCKYTSMTTIATMDYSRDGQNHQPTNYPAVVSAIEFDKDGEYFVIAGIAHKMKLYDFESVMEKPSAATPIAILPTTIKVSNVCWNPFTKPILATSYYNGNVEVWDAHVTKPLHTYQEHEKRCWSIQFNNNDCNIMASGSDDQKVKIWSLCQGNSVATIDTKVLICCVHFNPGIKTQLAFGGSDHCIYLYDLRYLYKPFKILKGHKKAVSYVKYIDSTHIVSASTDSTLRVWNIHDNQAEEILEGHLNEKNFVGLATNGEHIVCGSESNEVYTYYKKCQRPVCKYDFALDGTDDWTGLSIPRISTAESDFVSALCWKKESNIVMAANSQGKAQILQLT